MDEKQLLELMDYLASSDFAEFELERGGFKLRLVKQPRQVTAVTPAAPATPTPATASVAELSAPVGTSGPSSPGSEDASRQ